MLTMGGGGIANIPQVGVSTVVISDTTITDNYADNGGGIFNYASLVGTTATAEVSHSTITNNSSDNLGGGVANISSEGNANFSAINLTFSHNDAEGSPGNGGAIYNKTDTSSATTAINHSTFVHNTASTNGWNIFNENGNVTLKNSIIANGNCYGSSIIDLQYNLVKDASCGTVFEENIFLDPNLADNGGKTLTYALELDSPAVDIIPSNLCDTPTDQRGILRPFGSGCDSGSFELNETELEFNQSVISSNPNPTYVKPGEIITFTVTASLVGPGISNGIITTNQPEELTILEPILIEPPESGEIGTPPTLAHNIVISANQSITITIWAEISLGLSPDHPLIFHDVSFSSNEIVEPETDRVTLDIINAPPVAVDDWGPEFTTNPSTSFVIGNMLENDYDPNNDLITIQATFTEDLLGLLSENENGTFTYDPNGQFDEMVSGQTEFDTFQYTIKDGVGGFSDSATVTIAIRKDDIEIYLPLVVKR